MHGHSDSTSAMADEPGILEIHGQASGPVLVYPKPDHQPAVFTVLNLQVHDVDRAVDALIGAGVGVERSAARTGSGPIPRASPRAEGEGGGPGPSIAWFRDPSGNILAVLEG